jgi:predicted FMN-binding regulatory protein PaiB
VHIKDAFAIHDVETARCIVREHPFATLVTADLRATHMPCLVDEDAGGLAVVGHVAKADPMAMCRRAGTTATRSLLGTT